MLQTRAAECTAWHAVIRPLTTPRCSVHLDVDVDIADELERCEERDGAEHEEEDVARQERVSEELDRLQHAGHARALEVVEE